MRICWTEPAARDLTSICDYISEHGSAATARRIALSTYEALKGCQNTQRAALQHAICDARTRLGWPAVPCRISYPRQRSGNPSHSSTCTELAIALEKGKMRILKSRRAGGAEENSCCESEEVGRVTELAGGDRNAEFLELAARVAIFFASWKTPHDIAKVTDTGGFLA